MGAVLTDNQSGANATQKVVEKVHEKIADKNSEAPVVTNNTEETVTITKTTNSAKEVPAVKEQPQISTELQKALDKLKNKNNGNDGITNKSGNQGDPNGTNNTNNYNGVPGTGNESGDGNGKGSKWFLHGRTMLLKPQLVDDSQESGIVVVEITVDKSGNVTHANPGARGSTTASGVLFAKARQASMKAKFNPSPEGIEEQKGTITFNFILN